MRTLVLCWFVVAMTLSSTLVKSAAGQGKDEGLRVGDASAVRAVLEQYRTSWLANDAEGVCGTFTNDAVLMPHHGIAPVVGMETIKEFWWPANANKTTIVKFSQTIDEVDGSGVLAYVRGRSEVAWTVGDGPSRQAWHDAGNFMALFRKTAGKWLISRLIWDDAPNETGLAFNKGEKWLDSSVFYEITGGSGFS